MGVAAAAAAAAAVTAFGLSHTSTVSASVLLAFVCRAYPIQYDGGFIALCMLLCLVHCNALSLCRVFVTTDLKRNMSRGNSLSDELELSSVLGDTRAYLYTSK